MTNKIIETFDLSKKYKLKGQKKDILALDKVNITINEGEIFGLLGPNGAGKTTLIQILTTLLQPTSGYAIIDGYNVLDNPKQIKNRIGLMLESDMLYYIATGYDNLKFFCKIYNIPNYRTKILESAEAFGLTKWLNQYVSNYSSGMKMKLALLRTLLLNRKIIFLDEPTLGLDVKMIAFIIERLKETDSTIFLTSHDMSVVEKLCNRIAFINNGQILKIGIKEDVKKLEQKGVQIEIEISKKINQLKAELYKKEFITDILDTDNGIIASLENRNNYRDLALVLSNYEFNRIKEVEYSLEDLFINLI